MRFPKVFTFLIALLGGAWLSLSCASPYVRESLHHDDLIRVTLRARVENGEPVDRGFQHPATISNVRLAHILSAIDVRMNVSDNGGGDRQPAFHTELIYLLGDHLSAAFKQANTTQEVVVEVIRRERNLGVFTQKYLTSFVAWVDADNRLQLHLSRCDWLIPKTEDEDDLREPVPGQQVQRFRVIGAQSINPIGAQSVAVHWRDPRFRRGDNLTVDVRGEVQRRRVLMESPEAIEEDDVRDFKPTQMPTDPETLRALADLEEARRKGAIPESEYQRQRRTLLEESSH